MKLYNRFDYGVLDTLDLHNISFLHAYLTSEAGHRLEKSRLRLNRKDILYRPQHSLQIGNSKDFDEELKQNRRVDSDNETGCQRTNAATSFGCKKNFIQLFCTVFNCSNHKHNTINNSRTRHKPL